MDKQLMQGKVKRCHFLAETADVVALYGKAADAKTRAKHEYFVHLLREAGRTVPRLVTIADWLKQHETIQAIQQAMADSKVRTSDKVTFKLDEEFPVEQDYWHDWWRGFRQSLKEAHTKGEHDTSMRCLITGKLVSPAPTHGDIKGLANVGGQSIGSTLIGFDKEAYCSYGLMQSANAAVSEGAMSAYRASLNELVKNHSRRLAGACVVHWYRKPVHKQDDPLALLLESPEQAELNAQHEAKRLLESVETGSRPSLADNSYYALTLSGAGGRVMVRDWMEGQFEELVKHINQWFDDLGIVGLSGRMKPGSPRMERVITCLLPPRRPKQRYDDWVKPVGSERLALLHAAIKGAPIGCSVIPRLTTEHQAFVLKGELDDLLKKGGKESSTVLSYSLLYARMALTRAYHLRKYRKEDNSTLAEQLRPMLNEGFPSPAYQCGRLVAVLAGLQRSALGTVGAGIVQRYYAAASTTPALVLGRLIRTSQFHLAKLDSPGLAHWYEGKIAGICDRMREGIPSTLSLEEQSLFALGYYQQLADMRGGSNNKDKEV